MRLDKFLAQADVAGRKKARILIANGEIKVNGEVQLDPAAEIEEEKDLVVYQGRQLASAKTVHYMFHKPSGCITAKSDLQHKTVFEYFKEEDRCGVFPVGRLDKDTEGLLLFTNDGKFEHALMHPTKHVDKTYYFWALGCIDEEKHKIIESGVDIGDETLTLPAKLKIEGSYLLTDLKQQYSYDFLKREQFKKDQMVTCGYLTISEGRKHQVKRMLKSIGCFVIYLKRIQIGGLKLDETLPVGEYRALSEEEIKQLFE
ncbi:MAG: pseudouridine synthase [Clostridiales bacterium]|nr:pseudouridine synthase [Clostridiales bacterium]